MNQRRPIVSVVIPTHDREPALSRCLASLAAQDVPAERLEVVVVNDGGKPIAADAMKELRERLTITMIEGAHQGPAAARNIGTSRARGECLAFIDDDCVADREWLRVLVETLDQHPQAAIGGTVTNALLSNRYSRASHHLIAFLYQYYHVEQRGALPFFTTNNLAVRATTFARTGGFDASFPFASEDRDWSDRFLHAGGKLVYAPAAVVHHAHSLSLGSFLQQHFRYGEGARRFHRSRAQRRGTGVRLEQGAFYRGMLRAPFVSSDPEPARVAALIAASQAVAALGWAVAALRGTAVPPAP